MGREGRPQGSAPSAPHPPASLQRPYLFRELFAGHAHENLVVKLAAGVDYAARAAFVLEAGRFVEFDGAFVEGVAAHFP